MGDLESVSLERTVALLGPHPTFGEQVGEVTVKTRKWGFRELLGDFQEAFPTVRHTGPVPAPGLGVLKWPRVKANSPEKSRHQRKLALQRWWHIPAIAVVLGSGIASTRDA